MKRVYIIIFYRLSTISGPRPGSVVLTTWASVKWVEYTLCSMCKRTVYYVHTIDKAEQGQDCT